MRSRTKSHIQVSVVDGIVVIQTTCPMCGKINPEIHAEYDQYNKYISGTKIKYAFPQLSISDREMIKTGICNKCCNRMF